MRTIDINRKIIDGYLQLLNNLSSDSKLDLISKLSLSLKKDMSLRKKDFYKAFGAWDKKDPADKLINEIRKSRSLNRQIEAL